MLIHFAFGGLGKQGRVKEQTQRVLNDILNYKRLKVSPNTEFLPTFHYQDNQEMPLPFDGPPTINDGKYIYYIQNTVMMICFINIPFNKLKSSKHHEQYGKFGIVLSTQFLKSNHIKPVRYYTENELWTDSLVKNFNRLGGGSKALQQEILTYRKPKTYFPNIQKSAQLKIETGPSGTVKTVIKYTRYPVNYNFKKEKEYRIAFPDDVQYMEFKEEDLDMVITPDSESCTLISAYFRDNWKHQPTTVIYPG